MRNHVAVLWLDAATILLCMVLGARIGMCEVSRAAALPAGVKAVWDLGKACRETTPIRERICVNGLWQWQPAEGQSEARARRQLGLLQGPRPLAAAGQQCSAAEPDRLSASELEGPRVGGPHRGLVPAGDRGAETLGGPPHRLDAGMRQFAGRGLRGRQKAGEMLFPSGEVDLTPLCRPGGRYGWRSRRRPCRCTTSWPFSATATRRGGAREPSRAAACAATSVSSARLPAARIADVKIDTSVRKGEITFDAALAGHRRRAPVCAAGHGRRPWPQGRRVRGQAFNGAAKSGRPIALTESWKPEKLWDIHTPENMYEAACRSWTSGGSVLDTALPVAFRLPRVLDRRPRLLSQWQPHFPLLLPHLECGRGAGDGHLRGRQGKHVAAEEHRRQFPLYQQLQLPAGRAPELSRGAAGRRRRRYAHRLHPAAFRRLRLDGGGRRPGQRLCPPRRRSTSASPRTIPRWYSTAMNHNATGYDEDMNPDLIDGVADPRVPRAKQGRRDGAAGGGRRPSPGSRPHRLSPLLGQPGLDAHEQFLPELRARSRSCATGSSTGPPWASSRSLRANTARLITWDWAMYRGWYKGKREFGSAAVPWEFCFAEWNCAVPRRPGFLDRRSGKDGSPLGESSSSAPAGSRIAGITPST